mmetsp:Transcript_24760/g.53840  ORF Transcript_24760/g.53840 Transcript_24760/m.53840 type:complete len:227 (-) Transcript_24760:1657-2337(-)
MVMPVTVLQVESQNDIVGLGGEIEDLHIDRVHSIHGAASRWKNLLQRELVVHLVLIRIVDVDLFLLFVATFACLLWATWRRGPRIDGTVYTQVLPRDLSIDIMGLEGNEPVAGPLSQPVVLVVSDTQARALLSDPPSCHTVMHRRPFSLVLDDSPINRARDHLAHVAQQARLQVRTELLSSLWRVLAKQQQKIAQLVGQVLLECSHAVLEVAVGKIEKSILEGLKQ